ncbi:hypothetical protein JCM17960_12860 [Magnetospira thiophila]
MQTIIITGATGFVGRHALKALHGGPWQVIAACRERARLDHDFTEEVLVGDLRDPEYAREIAARADTILHAAAWSSLHGHRRRSNALFRDPSLLLIEAARAGRVSRFIFVSTTGAASPSRAADPDSLGQKVGFWPHLDNVVTIEDRLREAVGQGLDQVLNMRFGLFVGEHYGLGLLPILVPRLKSHLVPWVAKGRSPMPLIAGEDIGLALRKAAESSLIPDFHGFNLLGPTVPRVRDVIIFLHREYGLPCPWFSVPFAVAHPFAGAMEALSHVTPFDPFISRGIIHLMQDFGVTNDKAAQQLNYHPNVDWRDAVCRQMAEMTIRQVKPMSMVKDYSPSTSRML